MPYEMSPVGQCWEVSQRFVSGDRKPMVYLSTREEAQSMVEMLDSDRDPIPAIDTYAVHSNVGLAELHTKFDGPDIRITIEHDGDSEVTLTKQKFDRWMSMMQSMADLHFGKFQ